MKTPDKAIIAISTIYRKINLWKNEQCEPLGLSAAQAPIISLVCMQEGISQNDIVEALALEKSVVAKSIGKLISTGYLIRKTNEKDKRAFNLYSTEKARNAYPILVKQSETCMKLLTDGLNNDEKSLLNKLLIRLKNNSETMLNSNQIAK